MSEYRIRSTGEVKTQGQIRRDNPNVSLPKVWNDNVNETLGIDPVLISPAPAPSAFDPVGGGNTALGSRTVGLDMAGVVGRVTVETS